jgi:hypothetical protein
MILPGPGLMRHRHAEAPTLAVTEPALRPKLKASLIAGGLRASDVARKSPAGRKPWDEVVIFKAIFARASTPTHKGRLPMLTALR